MGRDRDVLISSKAISYSKLFNKLCVRTAQGFSFLFWNSIKLIEMISVYFNTTSDSFYFLFCREGDSFK